MDKKKTSNVKTKFPKGFFTKERPEINLQDALKDVIPVKWIKSNIQNDKKTLRKETMWVFSKYRFDICFLY